MNFDFCDACGVAPSLTFSVLDSTGCERNVPNTRVKLGTFEMKVRFMFSLGWKRPFSESSNTLILCCTENVTLSRAELRWNGMSRFQAA